MRAIKASQNAESNRMFESDFFEFFSHIHPWQPPLFFIPIILGSAWMGFSVGVSVLGSIGLFFAGIVFWTLLEYWLHRELFHYDAKSKFGKKLVWFLHGVHHDWPHDRLRLVFPPTLSLPLAALFFGLFTVTVGETMRWPLMSGLCAGYLSYDMIHYWVHHFAPKSKVGKFLRRYHLQHHFKDPNTGYGVSNPLWDYVFGTAADGREPAAEKPQAQ